MHGGPKATGRRRRARRTAALAALVLAPWVGRAAPFRVDLDVQPSAIAVGQSAQLRFVVHDRSDAPPPEWPAIEGLDIRPAGQTREHAWRNGQRSEAVIYAFRVAARAPGVYEIAPRSYRIDGTPVPVAPVTLRVLHADSDGGGSDGDSGPPRLRARLSLDRDAYYVQETFAVIIELAHREMNLDARVGLDGLTAGGIEWGRFQELAGSRTRIDGTLYDVRRFRARARGLAPGRHTLAPTLEVAERVRARGRAPVDGMPPMFDDFFGGRVERRPHRVAVEPQTLEIRPLPEEDRPAEFSGAVGRFAFEVEADREETRVGEPVALRMIVEGEGNPDLVRAPPIEAGDAFRVYEPRLVERDIDAARGSGRKVFEAVLVPRAEAVDGIPPIVFAWFDPQAGEYRRVARGPLPLRVLPADEQPGDVVRGAPTPPDPDAAVARDLRYLKPPPTRWRGPAAATGMGRLLQMALDVAPLIAAVALMLAGHRRERLEQDTAFARRVRAPRVARRALREARAAAGAGDGTAFLEACWGAVADYFGNRLNLPPGEVTPGRVLEAVRTAGLATERAAEMRDRFRRWEDWRFGGGDPAEALAEADATLEAVRLFLRESERLRWR